MTILSVLKLTKLNSYNEMPSIRTKILGLNCRKEPNLSFFAITIRAPAGDESCGYLAMIFIKSNYNSRPCGGRKFDVVSFLLAVSYYNSRPCGGRKIIEPADKI